MKAVAIIPARGGSKRIPQKNLAPIAGEPMISHIIKIAMQSKVFDHVIVSTDDQTITKISTHLGALVIARDTALSGDTAPILPVIQDAISKTSYLNYDFVCMLLPTAIFIDPNTIVDAKTILEADQTLDYVITVQEFPSAPQRAIILSDSNAVKMLNPDQLNARSQDLEPYYHDAGQMSFGRKNSWIAGKHSFMSNTKAIVVPKYSSIDIDNIEDLDFARALSNIKRLE